MSFKTSKEELFKLYKEKIKQPMFDDLVLVVLGGEKGVVAEYFEKKINFSQLIVVEPITSLGKNSQTKNNYENFKIRNKGKILHYTLKELEDNPSMFIEVLLKNKITKKGMEIITNPFYNIHYSKEMIEVKKQINKILDNIKPVVKMNITKDQIKNLQKKHGLKRYNQSKTSILEEISKIKIGKLVVLIGFENGNFFKELISSGKIFNIAIVEPYNKVFDEKQKSILNDLKKLSNAAYDYFEIEKGKNETLRLFDFFSKKAVYMEEIEILINPKYIKENYNDTVKTLKTVKDIALDVTSLIGNSNGDDIYGIMNSLYNLRGLEKLKLLPKDLTYKNVITVAAGPSLDKHLEELKVLSEKFIVIAVEVVVEKLLKNGIFPDIVCSQERTLTVYSEYTRKFDDIIKKKAVYIAPALIHTYSLEEMDNIILVSQAYRSNCEMYIYDFYYHFTSPIQTSIHAGLIAINIALLFKPNNVIIFGHDLSVPIDKKSHAEGIKANDYYREDSEIITGNRGQKIYFPPLLKRFFNNTENMTLRYKKEMDIHFYNFSDGAKVTAFEDSNDVIFTKLLEEDNEDKEINKKLVLTKKEIKQEVLIQLKSELSTLQYQLDFLSRIDNMTRFTLNTKFIDIIINKKSILSQALRLLINDFIAKHALLNDNMEKWIADNVVEIFETAKIMLNIVNNTINILSNKDSLPLYNSEDLKKLYDFNFFAVIRDKLLDEDFNPIDDLNEQAFFYLLQSFLHTFQPLNYLHFFNLLLTFKTKFGLSRHNKKLYQKGIQRCIDFFYTKYREYLGGEDEKPEIFVRERLVSLLYEVERYDELINLINSHKKPTLFELDLLADAYNETGKFDLSFFIYKDLIKNNIQNKKIILNLFNNLVFMDKYAESLYFSSIIHESYKNDIIYNKNCDYLKEKLSSFVKKTSELSLKYLETCVPNHPFIKINNKNVLKNSDRIIELLGKQQNIQFMKFNDKYYFDKEPDTTFFIDDIVILK